MRMRSKLFVPASRPDLFPKALKSAADAICFDLEDSVLPERKQEARAYLHDFLLSRVQTDKKILVRINSVRGSLSAADLDAVLLPGLDLLVLPKVEDAAELVTTDAEMLVIEKKRGLLPLPLLPTIESPRGIRLAVEIASSPRVVGLQLGLADLLGPLGIRREDPLVLHQIRLAVRLAAGEAGVPCYDSAEPDFTDLEGFRRHSATARDLGYSGKSCIHPRQIEATNEIFSPTAEEIAHAKRVVTAANQAATGGAGAFSLDGAMVDWPIVSRAKEILSLAQSLDADSLASD